MEAIAEKELSKSVKRAEAAGLQLLADPDAAAVLARRCMGGKAGARELRRQIRREIEAPAAQKLLASSGSLRLRIKAGENSLVLAEEHP